MRNKVAYLHGEIAVYTYVRPTVNYTVNRGVLFERRGKENRARARGARTRRTRGRIEGRREREKEVEVGEEGEERRGERGRGCTATGRVYGARDDLRDDS